MLACLDIFKALTKSGLIYRRGILSKITRPFRASSSVNLFCLNIAEKALPISQGIEPGPISVFPVVNSTILLRSGLPAIVLSRKNLYINPIYFLYNAVVLQKTGLNLLKGAKI